MNLLPGGWISRVPTMPTGITGHGATEPEAGHTGMPAVKAGVGRPGPLGVDREQSAAGEHPGRRVERTLRRVAALAVHRDLARRPEEPRGPPAVEVLGLGDVGDPAPEDERQEERVAEGLVVGGEDRRAVDRDVLAPFDPDPPEEEQDRTQQRLEHPVGH